MPEMDWFWADIFGSKSFLKGNEKCGSKTSFDFHAGVLKKIEKNI